MATFKRMARVIDSETYVAFGLVLAMMMWIAWRSP